MENELIAAVATGWGRSAIGIVRLSGAGAAAAAGRVFSPMDGRPLADHPARKLIYGTLYDREGRAIDRALCTWSPAPGSYTGEETAELQCHGSPTVLTLALEALFAQGAKQAGPGEFTRRAFLNGRLDLAQADPSVIGVALLTFLSCSYIDYAGLPPAGQIVPDRMGGFQFRVLRRVCYQIKMLHLFPRFALLPAPETIRAFRHTYPKTDNN